MCAIGPETWVGRPAARAADRLQSAQVTLYYVARWRRRPLWEGRAPDGWRHLPSRPDLARRAETGRSPLAWPRATALWRRAIRSRQEAGEWVDRAGRGVRGQSRPVRLVVPLNGVPDVRPGSGPCRRLSSRLVAGDKSAPRPAPRARPSPTRLTCFGRQPGRPVTSPQSVSYGDHGAAIFHLAFAARAPGHRDRLGFRLAEQSRALGPLESPMRHWSRWAPRGHQPRASPIRAGPATKELAQAELT